MIRQTSRFYALPGGDPGVELTLQAMQTLAADGARDRGVRRIVEGVTHIARIQGIAFDRALRAFVARRWLFVPDHVEVEQVSHPVLAVDAIRRSGRARGDCDDVATFAAALALAAGRRVRFRVVGWGPEFSHVFAEIGAPDVGECASCWTDIDVTREQQGIPRDFLETHPPDRNALFYLH